MTLATTDFAQYFTPSPVVDLTFDVLTWLGLPAPGGRVIDPGCGAGAFLQGALRAGLSAHQLYGLDVDESLRCWWHESFSPDQRPHLAISDGLRGGGQGGFALVVGNPPFAGYRQAAADPGWAADYEWWEALGPRGGQLRLPREIWFVERALQLLQPGGRLALILPEGLFANYRWRKIRQLLGAACCWEALIGLPRSTFRHHQAAVKTCLLIATRQPAAPDHQVRLAELPDDASPPLAAPLLKAWAAGTTVAAPAPWAR